MRYLYFILALAPAMFSGRVEAAAIRTLRPEIPSAFEENRGQSPVEYRYVLVHQNGGFACDALYARTSSLPKRVPEKMTFVGANSGCLAEIVDPLPTYSNLYKGVAKSGSVENVRHYSMIRFRNVWPGVDIRYTAAAAGYTMTIEASSAAVLAQIRLAGSSFGVRVDSSAGNIVSPVGTFGVSGPVRAVGRFDPQEVSFAANERVARSCLVYLDAGQQDRRPSSPCLIS